MVVAVVLDVRPAVLRSNIYVWCTQRCVPNGGDVRRKEAILAMVAITSTGRRVIVPTRSLGM